MLWYTRHGGVDGGWYVVHFVPIGSPNLPQKKMAQELPAIPHYTLNMFQTLGSGPSTPVAGIGTPKGVN